MNADDDKRNGATDASFEARLRPARERRGMDAAAGVKPGPASLSAMGIGMRVGVELVSALVVGVAIGWGRDRWLHTSPALLVVFLLLGGAAGVANVWRLVGPGRMPGAK